MLTNDKRITEASYWDELYSGNRKDAKVDSSNTVRPPQTFDRFDIVVKHAEGPNILGVGSGHATIEKRIKALHKDWNVIAGDQSHGARNVSNYSPYIICSAYEIPFQDKYFDTVIATQMMEYLEDQNRFLTEAQRVGKKFICTIPLGSMQKWSQLYIYDEQSFYGWIKEYGTIEIAENYTEILLVKIKFYE